MSTMQKSNDETRDIEFKTDPYDIANDSDDEIQGDLKLNDEYIVMVQRSSQFDSDIIESNHLDESDDSSDDSSEAEVEEYDSDEI